MTKKLYKNINGKRIELTEKEIQEYLDRQEANKIVVTNKLKQEKIEEYQKYLADTDYVVVKISAQDAVLLFTSITTGSYIILLSFE